MAKEFEFPTEVPKNHDSWLEGHISEARRGDFDFIPKKATIYKLNPDQVEYFGVETYTCGVMDHRAENSSYLSLRKKLFGVNTIEQKEGVLVASNRYHSKGFRFIDFSFMHQLSNKESSNIALRIFGLGTDVGGPLWQEYGKHFLDNALSDGLLVSGDIYVLEHYGTGKTSQLIEIK